MSTHAVSDSEENIPALPKVAIIGCGLIGAMWDTPETAHTYSLTHAAGFSKHPGCQLMAFCDADLARAQAAATRWSVPNAYADVACMLREIAPDIVVIAAASSARMALLQPVLAAKVKVCVIEKPLASSIDECHAVVNALQDSQTQSLVNFSRHWDPALHALGQRIAAGEWGQIQRLQAWYGKGLSNNGSHMIDLVGLLCDAQAQRVRASATPLAASEADWSQGKDLALDAQIIYQSRAGQTLQLDLLATDQSAFTCFELRILLQHAVIEISRGARQISLTPIVDDPNFANYRIPGAPSILPSGYLQTMDEMVAEAIKIAAGQLDKSRCDAKTALTTALTVEAIKRSLAEQESWQDVA